MELLDKVKYYIKSQLNLFPALKMKTPGIKPLSSGSGQPNVTATREGQTTTVQTKEGPHTWRVERGTSGKLRWHNITKKEASTREKKPTKLGIRTKPKEEPKPAKPKESEPPKREEPPDSPEPPPEEPSGEESEEETKPFKAGIHERIKEKLGSGALQESSPEKLAAFADKFRELRVRAVEAEDQEAVAAFDLAINTVNDEAGRQKKIEDAVPREAWKEPTNAGIENAFTALTDSITSEAMNWAVDDINDLYTANIDIEDLPGMTVDQLGTLEFAGIIESREENNIAVGPAFMENHKYIRKETTATGRVRYIYDEPKPKKPIEVPPEPAQKPKKEEEPGSSPKIPLEDDKPKEKLKDLFDEAKAKAEPGEPEKPKLEKKDEPEIKVEPLPDTDEYYKGLVTADGLELSKDEWKNYRRMTELQGDRKFNPQLDTMLDSWKLMGATVQVGGFDIMDDEGDVKWEKNRLNVFLHQLKDVVAGAQITEREGIRKGVKGHNRSVDSVEIPLSSMPEFYRAIEREGKNTRRGEPAMEMPEGGADYLKRIEPIEKELSKIAQKEYPLKDDLFNISSEEVAESDVLSRMTNRPGRMERLYTENPEILNEDEIELLIDQDIIPEEFREVLTEIEGKDLRVTYTEHGKTTSNPYNLMHSSEYFETVSAMREMLNDTPHILNYMAMIRSMREHILAGRITAPPEIQKNWDYSDIVSDTFKEGKPFKYHDFQSRGVQFLAGKGKGYLADEVGLGKTVQSIGAFLKLRKEGKAKKALFIVPGDIIHKFAEEYKLLAKKQGLSYTVIDGSAGQRSKQWKEAMDTDATFISYSKLQIKDGVDTKYIANLHENGFDTVIADEAHKFKTADSSRTQQLNNIVMRMKNAFLMSASPTPKDIEEARVQMSMLDPTILGNKAMFDDRFLDAERTEDASGRERVIVHGYKRVPELRALMDSTMLRRDQFTSKEIADALDLPPMEMMNMTTELTSSQGMLIDRLTDQDFNVYDWFNQNGRTFEGMKKRDEFTGQETGEWKKATPMNRVEWAMQASISPELILPNNKEYQDTRTPKVQAIMDTIKDHFAGELDPSTLERGDSPYKSGLHIEKEERHSNEDYAKWKGIKDKPRGVVIFSKFSGVRTILKRELMKEGYTEDQIGIIGSVYKTDENGVVQYSFNKRGSYYTGGIETESVKRKGKLSEFKQGVADKFNSGAYKVLLMPSPVEGMDLQKNGNLAMHIEPPGVPGTKQQNIGRIHRQGSESEKNQHVSFFGSHIDIGRDGLMRGRKSLLNTLQTDNIYVKNPNNFDDGDLRIMKAKTEEEREKIRKEIEGERSESRKENTISSTTRLLSRLRMKENKIQASPYGAEKLREKLNREMEKIKSKLKNVSEDVMTTARERTGYQDEIKF